ncbi:nicotinate-nucleotide adenylyltransferase [Fonticella tunisiensis]|uniref:Probable nicotinate-nucleotide adenylyltransferase n=1 Tax=Fonticella tunisiensis TaxID=1096341 RepID=A0A4R7KQ89_9CLOT|nr:nicotinate-nucleotide adenylyltransferase [Fonticella tunisiensis]TDT61215.1 nicotinate-nucleotide adenylyltransferase [Fonticella tunisiensis]
MKKIGIMGGTFNPIHIGHLIAAQEVLEKMNFDKILFMPVGDPPHKTGSDVISAEHRFEMVKLAIENNEKFEVSDIEVKRRGKTYTYDTLLELGNLNTNTSFYFIVGYDTLRDMDSWKRIDDVFKLSSFVVVNRGNDYTDMKKEIDKKVKKYSANIYLVDIPDIEISSTEIRKKVSENKSIRYMVPDKVLEYILNKGLYRGE